MFTLLYKCLISLFFTFCGMILFSMGHWFFGALCLVPSADLLWDLITENLI
jgi:hypothetical protein